MSNSEKIEFLFFIDCETTYVNHKPVKKYILRKVPVVQETRYSYYVSMFNFIKTHDEFGKRYGIYDEKTEKYLVADFSKCFLVKKDYMVAKISNCGYTHRQYYQHPFLARECFFVQRNADKIGKALSQSKNAFLLRQIAHNLEIENLEELEYEDA